MNLPYLVRLYYFSFSFGNVILVKSETTTETQGHEPFPRPSPPKCWMSRPDADQVEAAAVESIQHIEIQRTTKDKAT